MRRRFFANTSNFCSPTARTTEDVRHERTTDAVNEFFDPAPFHERTFDMRQEFDYAGLEGRLLSSSYAPGPEHPKHEPMLRELRRVFEAHAAARYA